jgi:hypothetical protein
MAYTLGTAAKATGRGKATIYRAIKSGKISATRHEEGSYTIDPAELHRVFPPVSIGTVSTTASDEGMKQSETPSETTGTPELTIRNAQLEAEISGLKELLRNHREQTENMLRMQRDQIDDLRAERDRLLNQVDATHRLLTHQQNASIAKEPKRFWWFRRSA